MLATGRGRCEGPAKGWVHTHGLAAHGLPELEIRNVPLFLGRRAGALLNDVADYLLNDLAKPFVAGNLVLVRARLDHLERRVAEVDEVHGSRLGRVDSTGSAAALHRDRR